MQKPLVTIICGGLNAEKFVQRSLKSILAQSYENVECIFVNDGSVDNTGNIAESFVPLFYEKGFTYKIIQQQNMGFYPQSGIIKSRGKYICTLDVDDVLLPDSIEKRVSFLENNLDYSAVRTNGYVVQENDLDNQSVLFITDINEKNNIDIFEDLLFGKTNNWAGSYMVKSSVLFEIYPDKIVPMNRFGQNLQILMPVVYQNKTGFIDEPLMKYIKHDASFTTAVKSYQEKYIQLIEFKKIRKSMLDLLKIKDEKLTMGLDEAYNNIFLNLAFNFSEKEKFNIFYKKIKHKTINDKIKYTEINNKKTAFYYFRLFYFFKNRLGL